jgi:hypothetical protein
MRWLAAIAALLIIVYFILRDTAETPAPAPTAAPASQPVKQALPPPPSDEPAKSAASAPTLTAGFCDPQGERGIHRSLKAPEAADLRRVFGLVHTSAFSDAAPLLDRYLVAHPDDAQLSRLRSRLRAQTDVQEGFARTTRGIVTLAYPPDALGAGDAWNLAGRLDDALDEAARLTQTPRRDQLYAVAYRDRSELLAVTCVPSWAIGVYDGTLRLALDTMQNERNKDRELRHEALHAQLGPVVSGAPRWWDEGLAQYFEDHGKLGWNGAFAAMLRNKTYIPFKSLEGTFFVFEGTQDAALAYEQSHAMVQLLVDRQGEAVIARAVEALKSGAAKNGLIAAIDPTLSEADLLALLERSQPR